MRKSLLSVMLLILMMTGVSMADSLQDDSAEGKHIDAGVEFPFWVLGEIWDGL